MSRSPRFLAAYALLGLALAFSGTASWKLASDHRSGPLAPGAVDLVDRFLASVQQGDLKTACGLFSAFPACDPNRVRAASEHVRGLPGRGCCRRSRRAGTLDGEYVLFSIASRARRVSHRRRDRRPVRAFVRVAATPLVA